MTYPIITTKLYVPLARPSLVLRPRLLQRLYEGLSRKLVLISAPPGSGKTTLVSEWIGECGIPAAWLSLDDLDNDPLRFLTYFVKALQKTNGAAAETALDAVRSTTLDSVLTIQTNILTPLLYELAQVSTPLVLVLDDYHVITNPLIQEVVLFFLNNLPAHMHLLISTRADPPWPLARLRIHQDITELRAHDLNFTPGECAVYLNDKMGLALSSQDITALESRTEGWIAGLQMAALSIQGRQRSGNVSAFIKGFTGGNRFVLDYLVEEVLQQRPPEIQDFLLKTSILSRMNAALCAAVTQEANSQDVLEQLYRSNLFLIALDDERHWYRYHHLFADLLRHRLQQDYPGQISPLYRLASQWCEKAGRIEEAVNYAFLAGHEPYTVDLLERQILRTIALGEYALVRQWLGSLPEPTLCLSPILCVAKGWVTVSVNAASYKLAADWMQAAEDGLAQVNPIHAEYRNVVAANLAAFRVEQARWQGRPVPELITLCLQALDFVADQNSQIRSLLLTNLGTFYLLAGDFKAANRTYNEAMQTGIASRNYTAALSALTSQVTYAYRAGKLTEAAQVCQEGIRSVLQPVEQSWESPPDTARIYAMLGMILLEKNDLAGAKENLCKTFDLFPKLRPTWIQAQSLFALARTLRAQGEIAAIPEFSCLPAMQLPELANHYAAWQARTWVLRSEQDPAYLTQAGEWAAKVQAESGQRQLTLAEMLALAQVRLAQSEAGQAPGCRPCLELLTQAVAKARANGWNMDVIEIQVLRARLLQCLQDEPGAAAAVKEALQLAEPEGIVRVFIDQGEPMERLLRLSLKQAGDPLKCFIERLLSLLHPEPKQKAAQPASLIEPLSEREIEVLRLLNTSLTSTEIAERLFISTSTVRTHIKNIYSKLDVSRRIEAIQRADELGLL